MPTRWVSWLLLACLPIPGLAAAQTATISGRVTDSNGVGLTNVLVRASGGGGLTEPSALTDGSGAYVMPAVPTGAYVVRTTNTAGYVDELYNNVPCLIDDTVPGSFNIIPYIATYCPGYSTFSIVPWSNFTNVDFTLVRGGTISGRVTDASGTGLNFVQVALYRPWPGEYLTVTTATTDTTGTYTIARGLPTGTYFLRTFNWAGYIDEIYRDVPCQGPIQSCPPGTGVRVTQGLVTTIDFVLDRLGRIAGRVTDAAGNGIMGIGVYVYRKDSAGFTQVAWTSATDWNGTYTISTGLMPGTYYVKTSNRIGYFDEAFDNVPCPNDLSDCPAAAGVSVPSGSTVQVNFALDSGGRITGRVISADDQLGMSGVLVRVYQKASGGAYVQVDTATTDPSGSFVTSALVTGAYYLHTSNSVFHLDEVYDGVPCSESIADCPGGTVVNVGPGTTPNVNFVLARGKLPPPMPPGDYDGDGLADVAVFRPATGAWYIVRSTTGVAQVVSWGLEGDVPVPADYDGDGRSDIAVYRPATAVWFVVHSASGRATSLEWGRAGSSNIPGDIDVPVPADYDGDGKADIAIFRPVTGTWWIIPSATGVAYLLAWGEMGDVAVPGDYDGDGTADPTVFRPATGTWYQWQSRSRQATAVAWGQKYDVPLVGDFDRDGKADPTLFRAETGTWYEWRSRTGEGIGLGWGAAGDLPLLGDYDGDGVSDPTVFRRSSGFWYQHRSTTDSGMGMAWGQKGDVPR